MQHIWDDLLSEQDKAVIHKAEYDTKGAASWDSRALGEHPALIVIDMQRLSVGQNVPILEAIDDYRTAMGEIAWQAIAHIAPFLEACRAAGLPVFHARVMSQSYAPGDPALQIVAPLKPHAGEVVIDKSHSSAFYGTDLLTRLVRLGVDTLIVTGNSTSGCVRATAIDARQHGFNAVVPVECTFDRIETSHKISLLDLWMKYAIVLPVEEVTDYVKRVAVRGRG